MSAAPTPASRRRTARRRLSFAGWVFIGSVGFCLAAWIALLTFAATRNGWF